MNILNRHHANIINYLNTNEWCVNNPITKTEVIHFLSDVCTKFSGIPGLTNIFKTMEQNLKDNRSIKWLNYFSQLRVAIFLMESNIVVSSFEKKNSNGHPIDIEVQGKFLCEVKSFEANLSEPPITLQNEEWVIDNFLNNKIIPALVTQKADYLVIDDIFSDNSKNYKFLNHYFSSIRYPDTDRYKLIHAKLDMYLPRLLILSFTQQFGYHPTIRYAGENWNKLFTSH